MPDLKQAPPRMDSWLQKLRYWMRIKSPREMYFYSVLVGIASGLCAVLFSYGLAFAESFLMGDLAGLQFTHPPGEISLHHGGEDVVYRPWLLFFLPI
ncbi:MAG: hypothetical protein KDK27_08870, partial [Leptospiraceae bacterium]|nr:hypothetical protein [Leptospiraceae bacterium]